jgi:hypothetical protein
MRRSLLWLSAGLTLLSTGLAVAETNDTPRNLILFVPDGLRAASVDAANAPTMARLRNEGVSFRNSHSLFPTFTTANASACARSTCIGAVTIYMSRPSSAPPPPAAGRRR